MCTSPYCWVIRMACALTYHQSIKNTLFSKEPAFRGLGHISALITNFLRLLYNMHYSSSFISIAFFIQVQSVSDSTIVCSSFQCQWRMLSHTYGAEKRYKVRYHNILYSTVLSGCAMYIIIWIWILSLSNSKTDLPWSYYCSSGLPKKACVIPCTYTPVPILFVNEKDNW